MSRLSRFILCVLALLMGWACRESLAQEQIDKGDETSKGGGVPLASMTLRVRIVRAVPEQKEVHVSWRQGGEGLGGTVSRGEFKSADGKATMPIGQWSAPLPLAEIAGKGGGWKFPNIMVGIPSAKKSQSLSQTAVEIEISDKGKPFKTFTEDAPKGGTIGFAVPAGAADRASFVAGLQGLSAHARARREHLQKAQGGPATMPSQFGIIGHLGGYGEGTGYGIRHCNPQIVKDECLTLKMLGVNGLVGNIDRADVAGMGADFRRVYWGGPGSGSPMNLFKKKANQDIEPCPFDPALAPNMAARVKEAIEEYKQVGAKESWGIWWDEIGVAAKDHIAKCPKCADKFREYLRSEHLEPAAFGRKSWDEIKPYPIWPEQPPAAEAVPAVPADKGAKGAKGKTAKAVKPPKVKGKRNEMAEAPADPGDALRYYYTFRFMTYATAQLFPESAKKLKEAGVLLYAMQGPTPSWSGHSLDWHEFYDLGANTACVFETSNREPRVWQWESYLGDIMRGISARHDLPMGSLIKPHRGAPQQRMLTLVSRGVRTFEWYTYGPDYAKGDSFSQSPELLEKVAYAARFLGQTEDLLYGAKPAGDAQVAFVSPRSSEIWGKATDLNVTAFEDAKWVYLALTHAHVPLDVLSEQQLAEGKLGRYKVIYVIGPNLRNDSRQQLHRWVEAGGVLWTDAIGLSRDEANQPAAFPVAGTRKLETWGSVDPYKATTLTPLKETNVPTGAKFTWDINAIGKGAATAGVGREAFDHPKTGDVLAQFADGKPALIRRDVGKGQVYTCAFWAGLTYSAKVRRDDFDMRADFDPALSALIAAPVIERGAYRPAIPSEPLVEAIALTKDGHRSIALVNWAYKQPPGGRRSAELQTVQNLRVALPGVGPLQSVRSTVHGPLQLERAGNTVSVVIPKMNEIDLLILQ